MPGTQFSRLLLHFHGPVCQLCPPAVEDKFSTSLTPSLEPNALNQRMPSGGVGSLGPRRENVKFISPFQLIND